MFRLMDTTKQGNLFAAPFVAVALCSIAYAIYGLLETPPDSWTLVLTVIASVIICGPFQIRVSRSNTFPLVGGAVAMLAIPPIDGLPLLSVAVWTVGVLISQTIMRRNLVHALYLAGLSSIAAAVFVTIERGLTGLGVWLAPSLLIATAAYYLVFLTGEFGRQWARAEIDRGVDVFTIDPVRIGLVILVVAATAIVMNYLDSAVIPWLEQDPDAHLTPLVVLLVAAIFYMLAQRNRFAGIERRLSALVDAAVELPRAAAEGDLAAALVSRVRSVVQAGKVELRRAPPEHNEIGTLVQLGGSEGRYLVASQKIGGIPFEREDDRALATLAHLADETARAQREVKTLEHQANSDALTGLPNYGAFQKALTEANENRSYHQGIALLFIDLDNFKQLNDSFGHRVGDELLKEVSLRLRSAAGGGDFVSRIGGDEFVLIFSDLLSLDQAKAAADRIVATASQPLMIEGQSMTPSLSAGLAFSSHRELDAQALVEDADRAMLHVKRSRRRGAPAAVSSVSVSSHRSSRTNDIVARAIKENRLLLAFQPIVDIERNEIWAFEALVRYVDPELGPVSPPSLVARSKSLGLMNELTEQVIEKALDAAEQFRRIEPSIHCVTVNLELGQITESELGPFLRDAAAAHPDITLCIELNEQSLRSATPELRCDAERLQSSGLIVALDDYGSDASSVGALVHFPMNILKIDRSLIDNLSDVRQREVIKALQGFGDNLDCTVVVEGVENREMAEVLASLGVRSAQGYYFGRPISQPMIVDRLQRSGRRAVIDG